MSFQESFDLRGLNFEPSTVDLVLNAAGQPDKPVLIHMHYIAGMVPAVDNRCCC